MISKMYILIKSEVTVPGRPGCIDLDDQPDAVVPVDVGHAVNTVAHAGAMIATRWPRNVDVNAGSAGDALCCALCGLGPDGEDPVMAEWYDNSFRKVCCKVTEAQFEKAKTYFDEWFVVTESAFGNAEVAVVFKPREEWPPFFKSLKLYK